MARDTWLIRYEQMKRRIMEANSRNRDALMSLLTQLNIAHVVVNYDGSGDSGQIESIGFYDADNSFIENPAFETTKPIPWFDNQLKLNSDSMSIPDAIEKLCYDYLEIHHGGWENNEGAYGEFRFDVAKNTISLTHLDRIISTEMTEHDDL